MNHGERPIKKTAISGQELEAMLATSALALPLPAVAAGAAKSPWPICAIYAKLATTSAQAPVVWLEAADFRQGTIFRRVWKGRVGPALLPSAVATIVKRRAAMAGLKGDFGGHSLRSGFVTEAGKQGVTLPAVMAMTAHRSVSR